MNVRQELNKLRTCVENAGFFAALQPLNEDGTGIRLVCATEGGDWGLGGRSFWIALDESRWIVGLWLPEYFEVPSHINPADVALYLLNNLQGSLCDLDDETVARFDLKRTEDF